VINEILIDCVALFIGMIGITCSISASFKIKGKFKSAHNFLLTGFIFGYLSMVIFLLEDLMVIGEPITSALQKMFLALAAIFIIISCKMNHDLYKNIPSVLLEKLK